MEGLENIGPLLLLVAKGGIYGGFVTAIVAVLKAMAPAVNGWRTLIPVLLLSAIFAYGDRALVTPTPVWAITGLIFVFTLAAALGVNLSLAKQLNGQYPSMKVNKNGSDT